jgi:dTDP-4-dehydrorhamnose reductase
MEKIMIVGGSGLLGGHLIYAAQRDFDVVATYLGHPIEVPGCTCIPMDITDTQGTENIVLNKKPDVIILSAAQRNVDYCEQNREEVWKINVEGARNVALASKKSDSKLIYLSTDLVFDGNKGQYVEEDTTNPMNHYGVTKLEGEREVERVLEDHAIARVSVLYDVNPFKHTTNFVAWVYSNLKQEKPLSLYTDQYRNATYIKNACNALISIFKKDEKGIFHVAGKTCENRYDIGMKVAEIFGFDNSLISKTTSDKGDWLALRPNKCCLSVDKMETRLGISAVSIEGGLEAMKREIDEEKP